jgi:Holliday junction resolvase-like predicted endonuclease
VDRTKQRNMSKTALDYLRLLDNPQVKFRFDIVEVILQDGARQPQDIRVIPNAFELSEPYHY